VRRTRWLIAILITVAVAIGYLDRQTLAVAVKAIQVDIPLSDKDFGNLQAVFFFAYAFMYMGGGRLMDALGTRRGFLLMMVWWSLACAAHGLATGVLMLAAGRLMLGLAQGGAFPASAKAVAEWFPTRERATAMGMINGGSSVGAVVAPPAIALLLGYASWPWVFYLSGALGLLWTVWWLYEYFPPAQHPRLSAQERQELREVLAAATQPGPHISWWSLLVLPSVWGMVLGKCCCDALWFTYVGWMPKYLLDMHGFTSTELGCMAWIPYAASGVGSVAGGWLSGQLLLRGYSLNFSRKVVLGMSAALMPCMLLVTRVPVGVEIALFSVAFFCHLSFSTLVITLPTDLFPRHVVGSVAGLVGFGGSMGGVLFNTLAGYLLHSFGRASGYPIVFAIGSTFHVLGFLVILFIIRDIRPITFHKEPLGPLPVPALAMAGEIDGGPPNA
jgi:ACS family hexuronate transporter-like MFS transporter